MPTSQCKQGATKRGIVYRKTKNILQCKMVDDIPSIINWLSNKNR